MRETRTSVILTRLARNLRKETGDSRYRARAEIEHPGFATLIYISCTRPLRECFNSSNYAEVLRYIL